jgi:hypothetical protein
VIDCKNAGYGKLHNKVTAAAVPYIRLHTFHYIDRFLRKELRLTIIIQRHPSVHLEHYCWMLNTKIQIIKLTHSVEQSPC